MTEAQKQATPDLPVQDIRPTKARQLQGPLRVAKFLVDTFAYNGKNPPRRDPPSASKTQHLRLITIKVSHYCEKVRWGLDLLESDNNDSPIYYTEDAHPPAMHAFATIAASQDQCSITPMVINTEDGVCYAKSDVILRKFCPFLYPTDIAQEVRDMEDDLGARLGATIRAYAYEYMLMPENHEALVGICANDTTKIERVLFDKMLDKGISKGMRKAMGISAESAARSKTAIRQVFAELSTRLENNGGQFLLDESSRNKSYGFTAADLTFAALASPLLRPPELAANFSCSDDQLPKNLFEFANELKATTAGKHVLKMYAQYRLPTPTTSKNANSVVALKSVNRNRTPWPEFAVFAGVVVAVGAVVYQKAMRVN